MGMLDFLNGKLKCIVCSAEAPRKAMVVGFYEKKAAVCRTHMEQWEASGRKCSSCQSTVSGLQEVAFQADRKGFGHADCGGIRLQP
ncbi:MAG TPA: hypothetical protein VED18_02730 [Candidatus Sulfotelmatobacter sp.]|nr:hypothetical protein [Candidatus Sulfotelmatobacter sp.]